MTIKIEHNESEKKFFAMVEGHEALLSYRVVKNGVWDFYHTFVPPPLRNRGIAGKLVEHALAYARKHKYAVIPSCPYVRTYVDEHDEWGDLLVD